MRKRTPKQSPPDVTPRQDGNIIRQVRHYKVITPLFGGGAEPHKPDAVTVVRGSEIRGLLRFWWRAIRGGQFNGNLDHMRGREEKIWGSASKQGSAGPSEVQLHINLTHGGRLFQAKDHKGKLVKNIGDVKSIYSYIAFPLRDVPGAYVLEGVEFDLEIQFPKELAEEVEAALWAWETFGGIGARTRRGFGALQLVKINGSAASLPNAAQIENTVRSQISQWTTNGHWVAGVPHLHPQSPIATKPGFKSAITAWEYLFNKYKKFRQARYPDAKGRPYGRSKWPEPDTIRRLTHRHSRGHEPFHPVDGKFSRGRFGLPIIFQFKENDEKNGDPHKTILEGSEHDRFASRLIFRPIACQGGAVGLACILDGPADPPGGYVLKNQSDGNAFSHPSADLSSQEAKHIEPLKGEPDVLKAFLKTLRWKE